MGLFRCKTCVRTLVIQKHPSIFFRMVIQPVKTTVDRHGPQLCFQLQGNIRLLHLLDSPSACGPFGLSHGKVLQPSVSVLELHVQCWKVAVLKAFANDFVEQHGKLFCNDTFLFRVTHLGFAKSFQNLMNQITKLPRPKFRFQIIGCSQTQIFRQVKPIRTPKVTSKIGW